MKSLVHLILLAPLAVVHSVDLNSTKLTQPAKEALKCDSKELEAKKNEHRSIENRSSLALFYLRKEYVGCGVLIASSYILTALTVTEMFVNKIGETKVIFEISSRKSNKTYRIFDIMEIPICTDLRIIWLTEKVKEETDGVQRTPIASDDMVVPEVVRVEWKRVQENTFHRSVQEKFFKTTAKEHCLYETFDDKNIFGRYGNYLNDGSPLFYRKKLVAIAVSNTPKHINPSELYSVCYSTFGTCFNDINKLVGYELRPKMMKMDPTYFTYQSPKLGLRRRKGNTFVL